MDIDAAIERAREISKEDQSEFRDEIHELAELFLAIDGWLSKGGFLPKDWNGAGHPTHTTPWTKTD